MTTLEQLSPQMTPFEPRMIQDVKLSTTSSDKDVEGGTPPSYPLHETEELVVGGPGNRGQRLIHWFRVQRNRRRGCGACAHGNRPPKMVYKIIRAARFLFAAFILLSLVQLTVGGIAARKAYKSLKCVPVTPGELQDGLDVTIPLRSKRIIVHPSLSGGDSIITHDKNVPKGSVQFAVTFANGTAPDAVYDGCVTKVWGGTVVGLIPREGYKRAKISTFTIRVPESLHHPSVKFYGKGDKKVSDKKLKKIIRWWRKQQDNKVKHDHVESAD